MIYSNYWPFRATLTLVLRTLYANNNNNDNNNQVYILFRVQNDPRRLPTHLLHLSLQLLFHCLPEQ